MGASWLHVVDLDGGYVVILRADRLRALIEGE